MQFARLAFPIILLLLSIQAYAACPPGTEVKCIINGQPGTKVCGPQGFSSCVPDETGPPVVEIVITVPYRVMTVIYAPPGTKGGRSSSSVSYGNSSTTGTTTTTSDSFKNDFSISASGSTNPPSPVVIGFGASFEWAYSSTDSKAIDIKKTISSTITANGPSVDGVDHDRDQIWLLLRPRLDFYIQGNSVMWQLVAGAKFGRATTTLVESQRVKTSMRVS
jgi:hypothetical protein